jgi:hypothetical protein
LRFSLPGHYERPETGSFPSAVDPVRIVPLSKPQTSPILASPHLGPLWTIGDLWHCSGASRSLRSLRIPRNPRLSVVCVSLTASLPSSCAQYSNTHNPTSTHCSKTIAHTPGGLFGRRRQWRMGLRSHLPSKGIGLWPSSRRRTKNGSETDLRDPRYILPQTDCPLRDIQAPETPYTPHLVALLDYSLAIVGGEQLC